MNFPQPGDYGLTTQGTWVSAWVNLGQALLGDGSRFTHAFVVVSETEAVEAWSTGARRVLLSRYEGKSLTYSHLDLTPEQREVIVATASSLIGTPYSFFDYFSLALQHWNVRPKQVEEYIANCGHMVCSQLVDFCHLSAGVHLFDDNRLPQDVTPGDLLYLLLDC